MGAAHQAPPEDRTHRQLRPFAPLRICPYCGINSIGVVDPPSFPRGMTVSEVHSTVIQSNSRSRAGWWYPQLVLLFLAAGSYACDTPVYRYALERWGNDPYYVLCFAKGPESEVQATVRKIIEDPEEKEPPANVAYRRVDASKVEQLPEHRIERRAWKGHKTDNVPFYVVLTPLGVEIYSGPLTPDDAKKLLSSPKRQELAKALSAQKMVVVLLKSGKADEDKKASAVVRKVGASEELKELGLRAVEVDRKDPAETWLVRQLLSIEDDLPDLEEPMLFPIIGRAYIFPPYVGKGICVPNVQELVYVLTGPCTCEIKAGWGGLDLLTTWDWDAVVMRLWQGEDAPLPLGIPAPPKAAAEQPVKTIQAKTPAPKKPPLRQPAAKVPRDDKTRAPKKPAVRAQPAQEAPKPEPDFGSPILRNTLFAVGGLAIVVIALSFFILRRTHS